ncbi:MAG: aminotransferase class V-fold PLP-dependent enzyme [Prevotellaceae bacterium]|jgi:threonine aldolase|nr:aminotransferase class V-fold PLP-dependent enzyme [Prevotellaceae bacterium]
MNRKSFASDNNSGIHPVILAAIEDANTSHTIAYGDDVFTRTAEQKFKQHFGNAAEVFFVFNGTAANVLCLQAATKPYNAIICSELAHINVDECGAPERFTGCKLLTCPTTDGKITVNEIAKHLHGTGSQHHVQPKIISISQPTELGTVYSPDEINNIAQFAHANNLLLHVDGARLANAAAALNMEFKKFTADAGVDILSFGGTKNGMMYGEAVVLLKPELSENFMYIRKQAMQLASKMRFVSAQFIAYLNNNQCIKTACHSNKMAKLLEAKIKEIKQIKITQKVESNAVFALIPPKICNDLQKEYFFYLWDEKNCEARWMCSFDTNEDDINTFVETIKKLIKNI